MEDLLKGYIQTLEGVRSTEISVESFLYHQEVDANQVVYDGHAFNRYRLLIALQVQRHGDDQELLVTLFEQEIKAHQKASFQGVSDSLKLNALLLARYNNIDHLPLFIAAHRANFDTQFEFNSRYFLWNGIEKSFRYIEQLDQDQKDFFYLKVGNSVEGSRYNDQDISIWKTAIDRIFPTSLHFDSFEENLHFLLDLDEIQSATTLIEQWIALQKTKDHFFWQKLVRYYGYLGDSKSANWAAIELKKVTK